MLLLMAIPTPHASVRGFLFQSYSESVQEILDCRSKLNGQHKSIRTSLLHEQIKPLKRSKKFCGDENAYYRKSRSTSVKVRNINNSDQVL